MFSIRVSVGNCRRKPRSSREELAKERENQKRKMPWVCVPDHLGMYLVHSPPPPDSESLCPRRQSVTSFPVLLARRRASISGKLLAVAGAHVCRCVFNWSKHQRKRGGQGRECGRCTDSVSTGVSQPEVLGTWRLICNLLSSRKYWQSYE